MPSSRPGVAINIHRGGNTTTSSEGCQTIPPRQWDTFIAQVDTLAKRLGLPTSDAEVQQRLGEIERRRDASAQAGTADYRFGSAVPGLAVELRLRDGAVFVPSDSRYRWPRLSKRSALAERLESHKLSIVAALLLSPGVEPG